jgi:hypothetical protein
MSWQTLRLWEEDYVIQHATLVCPVRVLWWSYVAYCGEWGFDYAPADEFMAWLRMTEGVVIRDGGRGRLRRVALGIGLRPRETVDARYA